MKWNLSGKCQIICISLKRTVSVDLWWQILWRKEESLWGFLKHLRSSRVKGIEIVIVKLLYRFRVRCSNAVFVLLSVLRSRLCLRAASLRQRFEKRKKNARSRRWRRKSVKLPSSSCSLPSTRDLHISKSTLTRLKPSFPLHSHWKKLHNSEREGWKWNREIILVITV